MPPGFDDARDSQGKLSRVIAKAPQHRRSLDLPRDPGADVDLQFHCGFRAVGLPARLKRDLEAPGAASGTLRICYNHRL